MEDRILYCIAVLKRLAMRGRMLPALAAIALLPALTLNSQAANAQNASDVPPVASSIDQNGVDVLSRKLALTYASISIGPGGPGSLTYTLSTSNEAQGDISTRITTPGNPNGGTYTVFIGPSREDFTLSGTLGTGTFSSNQANGSTLTYNSANKQYTYTTGDGIVAVFSTIIPNMSLPSYDPQAITLTYPAGERLSFYYKVLNTDGVTNMVTPLSVATNLGYQLRYANSNFYSGSFTLFNMANETCDPAALTCTLSGTWPSLAWDSCCGATTITRNGQPLVTNTGTATSSTYSFASGRTVTYNADSTNLISSVSDGKGTWTYQNTNLYGGANIIHYPDQPTQAGRVVTYSHTDGRMIGDTMEVGQGPSRTYSYDTAGHLLYASERGVLGNINTSYTVDARGNQTQATTVSSVAGSLPDIVTSASYPSTCSNQKICNQPDYSVDANGNRTDYIYDPVHGGVTTVTLPAGPNGIRPQTRYGYTAISARYRDPTGAIVSGTPVYRITSVSTCRTTASCAGTADEIKSVLTYDPDQAALPISVTTSTGDGTLTTSIAKTYYPTGDLKTVDGPLAGTADMTRYYYDGVRRMTGTIGPDPDGAGSLKRRAARVAYNSDDQIVSSEIGTATGQGDADMATFAPLQQTLISYDAQGRKSLESIVAGGTTYSARQYSYTVAGMPECATVRMNPATFASLPTSACTLGTQSSFGPDRITRYTYNAFRWPTVIMAAYGTSSQANERTFTYATNGKLTSLADANGNLTTYGYDGFDRLVKTQLPSPTSAGISSTTDFELLSLNANGNVTNRRLRDGTSIGFTYDALNRVSTKTLPPGEAPVSYSYDNLGNPTTISGSSTLTFGYDALGRMTSAAQPYGSIAYQYDPAGRRTRSTWQDGQYVTYDYDNAGALTGIRENGGTVLASYAYDDLGRRTSRTFANGTSTIYGYDPGSRLTSLSLNGGASANTITLAGQNPLGQIGSRANSNGAYAWTGPTSASRAYTTNGLNQYAIVSGNAIGYDARGNLTSSLGTTYGYSSENMLRAVSGIAALSYDPTNRLIEYGTATPTRFVYDGATIAEEVDASGVIVRRYVAGPSSDEPIIWYEGPGLSNKRYVDQDERGSIVRITDGSAGTVAINSYDEFGIPATTNQGRFGYTGQVWLPEIGLGYYKARFYSATLGRFMQTDPIGYDDGMNWYNYAHGDPVNGRDPTGLQAIHPGDPPLPPVPGEIVVTGFYPWYPLEGSTQSLLAQLRNFMNNPSRGNWVPPKPQGTPRAPRRLNAYERRILKCNGADDQTLDGVVVIGFLPPFAYLDPNTDGQTLPADGGAGIFLRGGNASGSTSLAQMGLIAHEFSHAMGYNRGVSLTDILFQYAQYGYEQAPAEVSARAYSDRVINSIRSGQCR